MNNNRNGLPKTCLLIGLAVAFCLFWFRQHPVSGMTDWLVFGCTAAVFVLLLAVVLVTSFSGREHPMLDTPMSITTVVFFALQMGFAIAWKLIPLTFSFLITVIIEAVIVGLCIIFVMPMMTGKRSMDTQDSYDSGKVALIREWKAQADTIAMMVEDAGLKKELGSLSEEIRYSDPGSGKELAALEDRISSNLKLMREDAEDGDTERLKEHLKKVKILVAERKALCLTGK